MGCGIRMRLSKEEIGTLKAALKELDKDAALYLFGSRVSDKSRGGDIDLLVVSKKLGKRDARYLRQRFFDKFGEQKVDILIDHGDLKDPFVRRIYGRAIQL